MHRCLQVRFWAVAALLTLVAPPTPAAAQERHQMVGEAALELVDYPWEELGWTVRFLPSRAGVLGLAIGEQRRIEIYVRSWQTVDDVAHTLAHELGHAVDMTYGTPYRRREYRRMRGLSGDATWFGCDGCSDYATPAGDFAEVFEYWLLGAGDYRSQLGPPPAPDELELLSVVFVKPFEPSVHGFWRQRWRIAG